MNKAYLLVIAGTLFFSGCGSPEILEPRNGMVPFGVDLSGNWQIQAASARNQRRVRDAIRKTDGIDDDAVFGRGHSQSSQSSRNSSRRSGRVRGGLVYVFLQLGDSLKVTQTPHALFISFDRSVVDEYRFGENQLINIGQVEAQRVTGWEGGALVVETLGRNRMKLTEHFRLLENGQVLERTITLRSKELEEEEVIQLFDRQDN